MTTESTKAPDPDFVAAVERYRKVLRHPMRITTRAEADEFAAEKYAAHAALLAWGEEMRMALEEARKVIEPFAARAEHLEKTWLDHESHWHPAVGSEVTIGHLRAAREWIEKHGGGDA